MEMGNVRTLINNLLGTHGPDYEHTQTVKITERSHQKLRALAEMTGRSKTALAANLLMAAIDDAVEAIPDEPIDGFAMKDGGPVSLRQSVLSRAEVLYERAYNEHQFREHLRENGHIVDDDEVLSMQGEK